MRRPIVKYVLLLLFIASVAPAVPTPNGNGIKSGKLTASGTNIPTSFDTSAGSLVLSSVGGKGYRHLKCENETATEVTVITAQGTSAPSASSTARFFVPANSFRILDDFTVLDRVYVQSEGSAIATGTVECEVW
jgi:hypothetical protein